MPRVVEDQLGKFRTDPLFKQLQTQSEVSTFVHCCLGTRRLHSFLHARQEIVTLHFKICFTDYYEILVQFTLKSMIFSMYTGVLAINSVQIKYTLLFSPAMSENYVESEGILVYYMHISLIKNRVICVL